MTVRPDGGWGWIIALACFAVNVIVDGVKYSFGIMFVELVDTFQRSKSDTSWIMSIQIGILSLSGPVLAASVNRFGCKMTALVGTMISFAGFFASAFAQSLYVMYVTFGLLGGFGFGMMIMSMLVTLARYFDKRLAFASGIAAMGSGFGTLVFNPLSKILIDKYTWRGTFIINAGILLNGAVCALVLRPPGETLTNLLIEVVDKEKKERLETDNNHSDSRISRLKLVELHCSKDEEKTAKDNTVIQTNGKHYEVKKSDNPNVKNITDKSSEKLSETSELQEKDNESLNSVAIECISSTEKDQAVEGFENKTTELESKQSKMLQKGVDESVENEPFINSTTVTLCDKSNETGHKEVKPRRLFSLAPLKNPGFLCFMLAEIFIQLSLNTPFAFLPDMMLHKGFQTQDAVWMLFIIGLVSTVSRLVIGFVADLRFVNRLKLCNSIVVLNGVIVILCPFCSNYASFVAFSVCFGFSAGSSSSLRYVLIPDLFGIEMIADLHGIAMFFCGIAALVGLPKSGALFDATGSYVIPFVVAGAELTTSGILLFLIPTVRKYFKH